MSGSRGHGDERQAFETSLTIRSGPQPEPDADLPVPGQVPDVARAVRDLAASAARPEDAAWISSLTWSVGVLEPGLWRILLTAPDGHSFGRGLPAGEGLEPALADAADALQDFVADRLRAGLPLVPGTERPARPTVVDGVATWCDPTTSWSCPIGSYPRSAGRSAVRRTTAPVRDPGPRRR